MSLHNLQAASGSMGCGSSQISPTIFCSTCLPREQGSRTRTCSRCRVLQKSPPLRSDLMKLRVKDLQHFLSKRQINIKACVGKLPLLSFDQYSTLSYDQHQDVSRQVTPFITGPGIFTLLRNTSVVRSLPHCVDCCSSRSTSAVSRCYE